MLCLTRNPGESIYLDTTADGSIEVKVIARTKDGRLRLGIAAPASVNIRRAEIPALTKRAAHAQTNTHEQRQRAGQDAGARTSGGEGAAKTAA